MRVLFDQGVPVPLRERLTNHNVTTTHELDWHQVKNGELLQRAEETGFEVLMTTDQNLKYQQNLAGRRLAIAVLMTTSWLRIEKHAAELVSKINALKPGDYLEIPIP